MNLSLDYQSLPEPEFRQLLDQLDDAYHNDSGVIDDASYDHLKEIYESRFGERNVVGAPARGQKVTLPYHLASMRKPKEEKDYERWAKLHPGPYILEEKADGAAFLFQSKGGIRSGYLRGDGDIGQDASHVVDYLRIPHFQFDIAIRGEIVADKETFKEYEDQFVNPRNMVSGVLNRKQSFDPVIVSKLHFLAFRIMDSKETPEVQLLQLRQMGFETPWAATTPGFTLPWLDEVLAMRRSQATYEMDGLVIYQNKPIEYPTDDAPKEVIAYKGISESAETVVKEVTWEASKDRLLKPTIFYESVFLSGGNLQYATGNNARFIIDNGIGPGARIVVVRSKETIPKVVEILQKAEPGYPDPKVHGEYEYTGVEFVLKEDNDQVRIARMKHFLKVLDVEGLGPGRIKNLVEAGINTVHALLSASPDRLKEVQGFGTELATQIYFRLRSKRENVPLPKLMAASCIFPHFGETRFQDILDRYPDILQYSGHPQLAEAVQQVRGIKELAYEFAQQLPIFVKWMEEHPMITVALPKKPTSNNLAGMTVVFSGFRDKTHPLTDQIKERGGKVTTSVSGNTTLLIMKDVNDRKGKAEKAIQMGIPMISLEQFMAQYLN